MGFEVFIPDIVVGIDFGMTVSPVILSTSLAVHYIASVMFAGLSRLRSAQVSRIPWRPNGQHRPQSSIGQAAWVTRTETKSPRQLHTILEQEIL